MGVKELRDALTQVLRRVEAGEPVVVTRDGKAIAALVPMPDDPLARLIAEGRARPPLHPFRAAVPKHRWPLERSTTAVISEGREERP